MIPMSLGTLCDISLIIRVLFRKRVGLQHQRVQRHRHRKMVIQLLPISSLYLTFQLPYYAVVFIQLFVTLPDWTAYMQIVYFYYLFWLLTLLLPLICIGCLTDVTNKLKTSFMQLRGRNATVVPMINTRLQNRTVIR
jgi:hypothetical protein